MRKPSSKEVMVFCDKETQTATIRIFKFRNYVWAGGKTFEIKKNSRTLSELFRIIFKYSVEDIDIKLVLWNENDDKAKSYVLDMKKFDF